MSERIVKFAPEGAVSTVNELLALDHNSQLYEVMAFIGNNNAIADLENIWCIGHVYDPSDNHYWLFRNSKQGSESDFIRGDKLYQEFRTLNYSSAMDLNITKNNYNSHYVFTEYKHALKYSNDVKSGLYNDNNLTILVDRFGI